MNFIDQLTSLGCFDIKNHDDIEINFTINMLFFGKNKDIDVWFSDYDLMDQSSRNFIIDSLTFLKKNIGRIEDEINDNLVNYAKSEFATDVTDFFSSDIEISTLIFGGDPSCRILGNCCFGFSTSYEIEHGIGVVLKKWNFYKIGYADICLSGDN